MITFKVYGAGDLESLGGKIREWMGPYNMPIEIEKIIDIERFMIDGIESVPSVKIVVEADLERRDYAEYESFVAALKELSLELGDVISRTVRPDRISENGTK